MARIRPESQRCAGCARHRRWRSPTPGMRSPDATGGDGRGAALPVGHPGTAPDDVGRRAATPSRPTTRAGRLGRALLRRNIRSSVATTPRRRVRRRREGHAATNSCSGTTTVIPVSMAMLRAPAAGVSRIGPRLHASSSPGAVTARPSPPRPRNWPPPRRHEVVLFADLANPTSNGIYSASASKRWPIRSASTSPVGLAARVGPPGTAAYRKAVAKTKTRTSGRAEQSVLAVARRQHRQGSGLVDGPGETSRQSSTLRPPTSTRSN